MKYLKLFEEKGYPITSGSGYPPIVKMISAGHWFDSQLPKEDYWNWEWEWDWEWDRIGADNKYFYYYDEFVDDDIIDKIFDVLEKEGIDWEFGYGQHPTSTKKQTMISFKLNKEQIFKYADWYDEIKKYNL